MLLVIMNMSKCPKLMQSGKPSSEDFLRIMDFLAPGSTHDARMPHKSKVYNVLPVKGLSLGDSGEIPLGTVGDSAFPKHSWLIKCFNEETRDPKERYFNEKLCSARVVTENAFGMLKGRFRFLYKNGMSLTQF